MKHTIEEAEGNSEIVPATCLGQIGGGKVDGDAASREFQARVYNGTPDPLLAFFNGRFGKHDYS